MSHGRIFALTLLVSITAWGQTTSKPVLTDYPALIRVDVPPYPAIARAADISGTVEIQVVVEKGNVVEAQSKSVAVATWRGPALTEDGKRKLGLYLSNSAVENVKSWQFEEENRRTFVVTYVYSIEGQPTSSFEKPKVEFDLATATVIITATPLKPVEIHDPAPLN